MTERSDLLAGTRGRAVLAVLGVLLVASCLRPAITAVGPVLEQIGADTGLGSGALGLLAALPLLAFAAMSPLAHSISRRWGTDRTVLVALLVLVAGLLLRSLPVPGLLWVGTVLIGSGIAVGNVLVPAVVKRDFSGHISRLTGSYTVTMNSFAAVASGLAVPIASLAVGGWRIAIAIWAIPAGLAAVVWLLRTRMMTAAPNRSASPAASDDDGPRHVLWRSPLAWQVTVNMGLQSLVFYTLVNWLPSIEADHGVSAAASGGFLFIYQVAGIGGAFGVTVLMGWRPDQRAIAAVVTVPMLVALVGLWLAPQAVVAWVILAGLTSGSSIALALAMIGLRTRDTHDTSRLSGMAQGIGYLLAAVGPIAAGWIRGFTGGWTAVILLLLAITLIQAFVGSLAGRNRTIGD